MRKILLAVLSILLGVHFFTSAVADRPGREGQQPYTPTRLEWLTVKHGATLGKDSADYGIVFSSIPQKNTLVIRAVPKHNLLPADIQRMRNVQFAIRLAVKADARRRGWDSWLRIECDPPF